MLGLPLPLLPSVFLHIVAFVSEPLLDTKQEGWAQTFPIAQHLELGGTP